MKRSEINNLLDQACEFFSSCHFELPPFAFWSPQRWQSTGSEADEIRDNEQLGRFPEIIEDDEPRYYLCTEYPQI